MSKSEIIAKRWFSGKDTVGAVLIWNEHQGYKAYLGVATGIDPNLDAATIAVKDWGAKLDWEVAYAIFGKVMVRNNNGRRYIDYDGYSYPPLY